jgi:hypothetical protein
VVLDAPRAAQDRRRGKCSTALWVSLTTSPSRTIGDGVVLPRFLRAKRFRLQTGRCTVRKCTVRIKIGVENRRNRTAGRTLSTLTHHSQGPFLVEQSTGTVPNTSSRYYSYFEILLFCLWG